MNPPYSLYTTTVYSFFSMTILLRSETAERQARLLEGANEVHPTTSKPIYNIWLKRRLSPLESTLITPCA